MSYAHSSRARDCLVTQVAFFVLRSDAGVGRCERAGMQQFFAVLQLVPI